MRAHTLTQRNNALVNTTAYSHCRIAQNTSLLNVMCGRELIE